MADKGSSSPTSQTDLDSLLGSINQHISAEDVQTAQRNSETLKSQSKVAAYRMFAAPTR